MVCFSYQNNSNIGTVSGGAAHWTQVAFINFEANNSLAIFIAPNATGGNTTVTVSISPSNNSGAFTLSEYKSAVTTLDQKGTSSGTGSSFNTATLTTRFANETLIVFMGGDAGTALVSSPFNNRAGISFSGVTYARTADLDEATAGMYLRMHARFEYALRNLYSFSLLTFNWYSRCSGNVRVWSYIRHYGTENHKSWGCELSTAASLWDTRSWFIQ